MKALCLQGHIDSGCSSKKLCSLSSVWEESISGEERASPRCLLRIDPLLCHEHEPSSHTRIQWNVVFQRTSALSPVNLG
jgi:hypothetical protein